MVSALAEKYANQTLKAFGDDLSDEDLLDQFLNAGDADSQEAFRVLVERHGPMVLGVCRHVLSQHQDAEDAFQATFLVLARKGATIRNRRALAGWLHEVAHRIAVKARAMAMRRRAIERQGLEMSPPAIEQNGHDEAAAWNELRPVLHAEVERLPERYRIPVILSYLEGKTNEEVAALLRWPVGTVKGRLSRARDLLRSRLTRRGLTLSAAFLMTALSHGTVFAEVVPADLVQRTVRLAGKFGPRSVPPDRAGARSEGVFGGNGKTLAQAVLRLNRTNLKITPRSLGLGLLAIITFLAATGIWLTMFPRGGFSQVHAASSSQAASRTVATGAAKCH